MKKICVLLVCGFLLTACNSDGESGSPLTTSHTIIDWVDFVVINDTQYEAVYSAVIADPKYIGETVGEVAFNVKDNVSNPRYDTKNGDAAYLDEGTKLFAIKGMPDFIAVEDSYEVNGYKIYFADSGSKRFRFHYKDLNQSAISKIEIYHDGRKSGLINTISDEKKIDEFLQVLSDGETRQGFSPDTSSGDPKHYRMIFYTDQPLAHSYHLAFDGNDWYWHPWDTAILPKMIENYIQVSE